MTLFDNSVEINIFKCPSTFWGWYLYNYGKPIKDFSVGLQIIEKVQKKYYFVRVWIRARTVLKSTYPDNYDSRIPAV